MSETTVPEIFIIESLRLEEEENGHQEGQLLSKTLHLSGKEKTRYFYIRTKQEFDEIIDVFEDGNYRHLHLLKRPVSPSCRMEPLGEDVRILTSKGNRLKR